MTRATPIVICFILCNILFLNNTQSQWQQLTGIGNVVLELQVTGNTIFAGAYPGVFKSTDNGITWSGAGLNQGLFRSLLINNNIIFAGDIDDKILYMSSNFGVNWNQINDLNDEEVWALGGNASKIFAGTRLHGLYFSSNNGLNWQQTSINNVSIYGVAANENYVAVGYSSSGDMGGVYISSNNGASWVDNNLNGRPVDALWIETPNIYAGTLNGAFISTNNGANWSSYGLEGREVYQFYKYNNFMFAVSYLTIYLTTNNGLNWQDIGEGLPQGISFSDINMINNYVIIATVGGHAFRRLFSDFQSITLISDKIPKKYNLEQNYPNPFNPSTNLKFSIPQAGFVKLVIYDITGKEIESPVNEELSAGTYEVSWNAASYPSGIYFYTLYSGSFSQTNKMILVK